LMSLYHSRPAFLSLFVLPSSLPPPPRSPLFPYTTLFRSLAVAALAPHAADRIVGKPEDREERERRRAGRSGRPVMHALVDQEAVDRKSTRLNSSHQIISYAVFCLKKKKRTCDGPVLSHP